MIYVMSDLHGCYQEYKKALDLIHFSEKDLLYVLGDIIDRGDGPIQILKDMMMRSNVIPLIGNHEYMALTVLRRLCVEITEKNAQNHLKEEDLQNYRNWMINGGQTTLDEFKLLTYEEKMDILDYLEEFSLIEEVSVKNKKYVLVHGGLEPFDPDKPLDAYQLHEVIFRSVNYDRVYFKDRYLISGHRPTLMLKGEKKGKIYQINHHIAIDCGCVFGGNLGVYCLDTGEEFYVPKQ